MFSIANIVIQGAINSLGTVVMAASSAAYNIEVITYDILNSFSQACTTFVGQNFGAGEIKRCKKTLLLCLLEGIISLGVAIALILFFGKSLLTIFNGDPQVVETGYIRLMLIMPSHLFSLCYEVLSGYLRGFEISLPPAVLTDAGRLRRPPELAALGLPAVQDIYEHHAGLPHQPCDHGASNAGSGAVLPPLAPLCASAKE